MKIKKIMNTTVAAVLFAALVTLVSCGKVVNRPESYVQQLSYTETTERINNPDQGFYRPMYVKVTENGVAYTKSIVTESTQLYHLRVDISEFSGAVNNGEDKMLTQSALDGLSGLLAFLKSEDKNAVVRFAYDPSFGGSKDKEPQFNTVLEHVKQFCPVLNSYYGTVTAIEAGLIGPWGEMHSSKIANPEHISPLIAALLDNTADIPVLVRTPKMIYDFIGITLSAAADYIISPQEKAYRLGIYNDGYLGSDSDLGTYADRKTDIEFLARQTAHLPFGGEVVAPESKLHDIGVCLPEMNKINLSYLNTEWNNLVIEKWKESFYTQDCGGDGHYYGKTAFEYIENRLGYRYVLKKSVLSYPDDFDKLEGELSLENVGFGNLNKPKKVRIIITDCDGNKLYEGDFGEFSCGEKITFAVCPELQKGNYDVYLRLFGEEAEGAPLYCLRFANEGLWNSELKANKIGSINLFGAD